LVADAIEAQEGATIDLSQAAALKIPACAGEDLPANPADGSLVWDTTALAIKVAADGVWLPLALVI